MHRFPREAALKGSINSAQVHVNSARKFYAPLLPLVAELRRQGLSLRAIAKVLQASGIPPRIWHNWSATQVRRVLARAAAAGFSISPEGSAMNQRGKLRQTQQAAKRDVSK